MAEFIRIYLLFGLVLHKAIWEILKKSSDSRSDKKTIPGFNLSFIMKVAKIILLAILVLQIIFMQPVIPVSNDPETIVLIGLILYTTGLVVAIAGRIQLGSNWTNIEDGEVTEGRELVKNGVYRFIRHPIYTGDALLILGLELALNSWLFLLIFPLAFTILSRAKREERILVQSLPEYQVYQQQTKMFIPFLI